VIPWVGKWNVLTPPGLTGTGRIRRFQERTVARLRATAEQIAAQTYQELITGVDNIYREGSGELASTLQYRVDATRDGVEVTFMAGTRHLVFLTALAGQPLMSPGHKIPRLASSRGVKFFWKNPPGGGGAGVYSFRQVNWKTRFGRDIMAEVLSDGAQQFQRAMIAAHDDALVEFTQNELQIDTRSARVSTGGGSGIPPR
jgi:hypothetical protein